METEDGEVKKAQSTHWYRVGSAYSYTSDPRQADVGEVGRVGLHNCAELGCEEAHANSALDYSLWLLRTYAEGTWHPARGHRAQGVQGIPESEAPGRPVLRRRETAQQAQLPVL